MIAKKVYYENRMITPFEEHKELGKAVGANTVIFKREDLHPLKSHKGRSLPYMIDYYMKSGKTKFAISSSGNAALASTLYIQSLKRNDLELLIYVGNHINDQKYNDIQKLCNDNIRVLKKERPLQALTLAIDDGYCSLRQSTDDIALLGYESLAQEIIDYGNISSVFIGTSSGTTAQALASYFAKKNAPIPVHIVQTSSCHPMIDEFDSFDFKEEASLADAIVDINAFRKDSVVSMIRKTGGRGWLATNENIENAIDMTERYTGLHISPNSSLSLVGLTQAVYDGNIGERPLCMICGR